MSDRVSFDLLTFPSGMNSHIVRSWPQYWWLNLLLFALTLISTTVFGFALSYSFSESRPLLESDWLLGFQLLFTGNRAVWSGIWYSIPLILILLAHELGHYEFCRRWDVEATLPFFGPSPTLLGTIGAFIWIRSPIYRRRALFDIGISGPILGFMALVPFLIVGILKSKTCPAFQQRDEFTFGLPVLFRALEFIRFPGVPSDKICFHPMVMAAWAGLLATAINLLPIGQLDGGHIVYAVWGERVHRLTSWTIVFALALAGLLYSPWWIWAVAMIFFRRHPLVHDAEPIGWARQGAAFVALVLLLLSFSVVPIHAG